MTKRPLLAPGYANEILSLAQHGLLWLHACLIWGIERFLGRIRPVVLAMPLDLMRHDMLMTYEPIAPARVLEIVGDLFMPLVAIDGGRSFKG